MKPAELLQGRWLGWKTEVQEGRCHFRFSVHTHQIYSAAPWKPARLQQDKDFRCHSPISSYIWSSMKTTFAGLMKRWSKAGSNKDVYLQTDFSFTAVYMWKHSRCICAGYSERVYMHCSYFNPHPHSRSVSRLYPGFILEAWLSHLNYRWQKKRLPVGFSLPLESVWF